MTEAYLRAINPTTDETIDPPFSSGGDSEADQAGQLVRAVAALWVGDVQSMGVIGTRPGLLTLAA